jgi:hypothetical protein
LELRLAWLLLLLVVRLLLLGWQVVLVVSVILVVEVMVRMVLVRLVSLLVECKRQARWRLGDDGSRRRRRAIG